MNQTACTSTSGFSIKGYEIYPESDFQFEIDLSAGTWTEGDILCCEWHVDGMVVHGETGLSLVGELPCGQHSVAARLLTANGWTGLRSTPFENCKVALSRTIQGPAIVFGGSSAPYSVIETDIDGFPVDVTNLYTFTFSPYGHFEGNVLVTPPSEGPQDVAGQIQAHRTNNPTLTMEIVIRNIILFSTVIDDADFLVIRFTWQDYPISGHNMSAGIEGSNIPYNNNYVGAGHPSATVPADVQQPQTNAYLWWVQSQAGTQGTESVMLNLKKFSSDFAVPPDPGMDTVGPTAITVALNIIWWSEVTEQEGFAMAIRAYTGGEMQQQGTDFVNTGGSLVSPPSNVLIGQWSGTTQEVRGFYRVGAVYYDLWTKRMMLNVFHHIPY